MKKILLFVGVFCLVAVFLLIVVVVGGLEKHSEDVGVLYSNDKKPGLEECLRIDGSASDVVNIDRMYSSGEFNCLEYRLKTINPLNVHPDGVKLLGRVLHEMTAAGNGEGVYYDVRDIVAYIISTWSVREHGNGPGVIFDYSIHRDWLLNRMNGYETTTSYVASIVVRHGGEDDLAFVVGGFGGFGDTVKMMIFVNLLLRCDGYSEKFLYKIKTENPAWWKSRPEIDFKCNQ